MRAKIIFLLITLSLFALAIQISLVHANIMPPLNIDLTPETQTRYVGQQASLVATLTIPTINGSIPRVNSTVMIQVISGPNTGVSITDYTNAQGQVTLAYTGTTLGVDTVKATMFVESQPYIYDMATVTWVPLSNVVPEVPFGTIMLFASMMIAAGSFYIISKKHRTLI